MTTAPAATPPTTPQPSPLAQPSDDASPYVRSGADLARLLVALGALVVIIGLALWAGSGVRNVQIDLVALIANVPGYV